MLTPPFTGSPQFVYLLPHPLGPQVQPGQGCHVLVDDVVKLDNAHSQVLQDYVLGPGCNPIVVNPSKRDCAEAGSLAGSHSTEAEWLGDYH